MIGLVGLPGSSKSTVGRQLARRLQLPFFDSDHVIERQLGCSIREYFERARAKSGSCGSAGRRDFVVPPTPTDRTQAKKQSGIKSRKLANG